MKLQKQTLMYLTSKQALNEMKFWYKYIVALKNQVNYEDLCCFALATLKTKEPETLKSYYKIKQNYKYEGDYQGDFISIFKLKGWGCSATLTMKTEYGSCSSCDTLLSIKCLPEEEMYKQLVKFVRDLLFSYTTFKIKEGE